MGNDDQFHRGSEIGALTTKISMLCGKMDKMDQKIDKIVDKQREIESVQNDQKGFMRGILISIPFISGIVMWIINKFGGGE